MRKKMKITVTGAAGQIGYALLFRIASGQMLGPDVDVELNLLELERALPALNGVAMELDDCAFPLLKNIKCTSNLDEAFDGTNIVMCVGSVPRKNGMERADLLKINGGIFIDQGKAINKNAASDVKVFVVGNPCNTNCLIAMHNAPDVPNDRFFAMTTLDENRAKTQLAKKAGVDVNAIKNLTIWGNHSSTQYPDFFNTLINGKSAFDVIGDEQWLKNDFLTTVQKRGAAIIKARGASSAASAANAAVDGVRHLFTETPAGETYSMCLASQGHYGIDKDLIFSFPCRTENGIVKVVDTFEHNEYGKMMLDKTHAELKAERDTVRSLDLI